MEQNNLFLPLEGTMHYDQQMKDFKKHLFYFVITFYTIPICLVNANQNYYHTDPTVAQFKVIRGDGDSNYNGDIDFSIPLMTIPGRGNLNFDLILQYVDGNGVPATESASWVGLGWNLNLPQITCSPVNTLPIFHPSSYKYYENTKDIFNLTFPGGATAFMNFGSGDNDNECDWVPLNWSAIKIEGIGYGAKQWTHATGNITYHDYDHFVITDLNGRRYIFRNKLVQTSKQPLLCHGSSNPDISLYHYVYKLTEILDNNYVDGDDDDIPGTGGVDCGNWIQFKYSSNTYQFTEPYEYVCQTTEIDYLDEIVTPTYTAKFILAQSFAKEHPFLSNGVQWSSSTSTYLKSLEKIVLSPNKNPTTISKAISFNLSRDFGTMYFQGDVYEYKDVEPRRLRLNSLQMLGKDEVTAIPVYKFNYYGEPKLLDQSWDGEIDNWGYFKYKDSVINCPQYQPDCQNPDSMVTRWLLKSVTYPEGAILKFVCEADRYQEYFNCETGDAGNVGKIGGGIRLKQKILTDPHTGDQQIYSYVYSKENKKIPNGYGFVSSMPSTRDPEGYGAVDVTLGRNLHTDIHYPDVEITLPNGSRIHRFYSSALDEVALLNPTGTERDYKWIDDEPIGDRKLVLYEPDQDFLYWPQNAIVGDPYFPFYASYNHLPSAGALYKEWYWVLPFRDVYDTFNSSSPWFDGYSSICEAVQGEFSEFDDCNIMYHFHVSIGNSQTVNIACMNNSWKRGHILIEKLIPQDSNNPIEETKYYYTMVGKKTKAYNVVLATYRDFQQTTRLRAFTISGWARLDKTQKVSYDPVTHNSRTIHNYYNYNEINGLVDKKAEENNASTFRVTENVYAFEKYSNGTTDMLDNHIIAPIAQTIVYKFATLPDLSWELSDGTEQSSTVTTYKEWPLASGIWNANKTYEWKEDNNQVINNNYSLPAFEFTLWADSGEPDPNDPDDSEWIRTMKVNRIDAHSNILETTAANGLITSMRYGFDSSMPVCKAVNAKYGEFEYFHCEDGWQDWSSSGTFTTTEFWTGDHSVSCHNQYGPTKNFLYKVDGSGIDKTKTYIAEAWIKRNSGDAKIRIEVRDSGGNTLNSGVSTIISSDIDWQLIRTEITSNEMALMGDLSYLRVWCGFPATVPGEVNEGYVDDIRFFPKDALCTSYTYDHDHCLLNSVTNPNHMSKTYRYDDLGRLNEIKNEDRATQSTYEYSYSRDNNDDYDPNAPNFIEAANYPTTLSSEQMRTKTFYDGLGREIQEQNIGDGSDEIVSKQKYNTMGQVEKEFHPMYVSNSGHNYLTTATLFPDNISLSDADLEELESTYLARNQISVSDFNLSDGYLTLKSTAIVIDASSGDVVIGNGVTFHAVAVSSEDMLWPHETYEYEQNPLNRVITQTHHDQLVINNTYGIDGNNLMVSTTDENHRTSTAMTDVFGNNVKNTGELGLAWGQEFDILGNVTKVEPPISYPNDNTWSSLYTYNTVQKLIERYTPDEGTSKMKYDHMGNLLFSQNAEQTGSKFTVYKYDTFNRIVEIGVESSSNVWSYSDDAFPIITTNYATDPGEWKIRYYYDTNFVSGITENYCMNKLTKIEINDDEDTAIDHVYQYVYDKFGNLTEEHIQVEGLDTSPAKVIYYAYDRLGRMRSITYPSGNVVYHDYDQYGRISKIYNVN